jgi:sortase A
MENRQGQMGDRRAVDELSLEELEQILLIKRRQARQGRLRQLAAEGRLAGSSPLLAAEAPPPSRTPKSPWPAGGRFQSTNVRLLSDVPASGRGGVAPARSLVSKIRDRLLLGVEVLALIALVAILLSSYDTLRTLNTEVAVAREAQGVTVAATPTPLVSFDRLPGGHSSPNSPDGAVPDVPAHLQQWVQPAPAQPVPTPSAAHPTRIVIPSLNVDAPIVNGVAWEDLKKGVGHLPGSGNPGERGNMYLAAHNDIFGEIFRYLEKLELGDEFFVYSGDQSYRYVVTSKRVIEPTDVSVMYPSTEPIATLQTCYPYLVDTHRLVVVGELAD